MIDRIKTGDVFLTKSNSFLSKAIRYFMKVYAKKFKVPYKKDKIYSHAGTFVWIDDTLYLAESVGKGYRFRVFNEHYGINPESNTVLTPLKPYTALERKDIRYQAMTLVEVSIWYQWSNFITWIIYIYTKGHINLLGKGRNKGIMYCYEAVQTIKKLIRLSDYSKNPAVTSFFDLYNDPNFKQLT